MSDGPLLVDLFCKAGGATAGYQNAGFDCVGVDIEPQPHYPGSLFFWGDAMTVELGKADLVHASPPCHDHSPVTGQNRKAKGEKGTGWMLEAIIRRLQDWGGPWIVENVTGKAFPADVHKVRLCGSSFGLNVRRHRWFASNLPIVAPPCDHDWQTPRFRSLRSNLRKKGRLSPVVGVHGNCNYAGEFAVRCEAMGIDWMTNAELTQAIPPAYTEFLGRQVLEMI